MSSEFENNDLEFDPLEIEPISKKSMVIFFLVDSSGSMYGTKIGALNTTMEEIIPELRGIGGATTDIKLAVLSFSDGCKWLTETPISIDEYQYWTRLKADGLTDTGEAFQELSSKLSRKEFLKSPSLSYAPVIFLLSDGAATDDVRTGLKVLKNNRWYKYGMKISLGIGEHYDREILEEFTGNIELVFEAKTAEQLSRIIKTIAVTSSQIGSKSVTLVNDDNLKDRTEEDVMGDKEKRLIEEINKSWEDQNDGPVDEFDVDDGWDN